MESYPYKKHRGVGVLPSQLTSGAEHSRSESQAADARLSRHIDASANSSMLFGFWYPAMLSRDLRAGVVADRAQFFKDFSSPFYGYNRPSAKVSEGVRVSPFGFLTHSLTRMLYLDDNVPFCPR